MSIQCLNNQAGIGERCITQNDFSQFASMFLAVPGFQFDTAADFADQTKWLEAIRDKNLFPIPEILEIELADVEDQVYTTPNGRTIKIQDGIRGYNLKCLIDLKSHQTLRNYSGQNWSIFKADSNKNIMGTSPDGTVIKGFALSFFDVGKMMTPVAPDNPAFTPIYIQENDVNEWDSQGVYINNPTWLASQLVGVGTVTLTQVGVIAADAFVVTIDYVDDAMLDGQNSGADTSSAISGLLAANFALVDGGGAANVVVSVVEDSSVPGKYTVTGTNPFAAGTVQVLPSTTALWESDALTLS